MVVKEGCGVNVIWRITNFKATEGGIKRVELELRIPLGVGRLLKVVRNKDASQNVRR